MGWLWHKLDHDGHDIASNCKSQYLKIKLHLHAVSRQLSVPSMITQEFIDPTLDWDECRQKTSKHPTPFEGDMEAMIMAGDSYKHPPWQHFHRASSRSWTTEGCKESSGEWGMVGCGQERAIAHINQTRCRRHTSSLSLHGQRWSEFDVRRCWDWRR